MRISLLSRALAFGAALHPAAAQGPPPAPVQVAAAATRRVAPRLELPGTTIPYQSVLVASREEGVVTARVYGIYSAKVKAGDVLVRLDATRAEARLRAAQARLDAAKARLAELEAGERSETLDEARAQVRRARADQREAGANRRRIEDLFARQAATRDERDQAVRRGEVAAEELKAARSRLARLEAGSRREALAQARAAVDEQEAAVALAAAALADHEVKAPFAGVVDKVEVEVGGWVAQGGPVLRLLDISILDIGVLVPEDLAPKVPLGTTVPCAFAGGFEAEGKVVAIGSQADLQGRTVPVMVRVQNPRRELRSYISARVRLPTGPETDRLCIPKDAVLRDAGGSTRVFVVADGAAQPRPVTTGVDDGSFVEITAGLAAGERVVTQGNERLRPGQPVAAAPTEATP